MIVAAMVTVNWELVHVNIRNTILNNKYYLQIVLYKVISLFIILLFYLLFYYFLILFFIYFYVNNLVSYSQFLFYFILL